MLKKDLKNILFHITTGDIDGIGLEITLKALKKINISSAHCIFFIWIHQSQKDLVSLFLSQNSKIASNSNFIKEFSTQATKYKYNFILNSKNKPAHWFKEACRDCLKNGSSIITGPLSKTQIKAEGLTEIGHTEILKKLTKIDQLKMAFTGKFFSMILFTDHVPVNKIKISKSPFQKFLRLTQNFHTILKTKKSPLNIIGLNPHAGDNGIIGHEDLQILKWSQEVLGKLKLIPADSAFINFKKFKNNPTFVSMYHDQGLIPFKMAHGFTGYHMTLGLPFIRTSVDHGTAKDIFNQDVANPQSMIDAINAAIKFKKRNLSNVN